MDLKYLKEQIDLENFILSLGYSLSKQKSTRRTHVYTNGNEHIIVNQKGRIKLYFCSEGADRGTIVDFLYHRPTLLISSEGNIYKRIADTLQTFMQLPTATLPLMLDYNTKSRFNPLEYISNKQRFTREFNLLRVRGISDTTLHSGVFENIGLCTNGDHFTNIAFPMYNKEQELVGLDLRNFNYKNFASGTDKTHSLWLSNFIANVEEIVIAESPIDLLSFHQLFRAGKDNILYVSTGGILLSGQIAHILYLIHQKQQINPQLIFTNAFDNDLPGQLFTSRLLVSMIEDKPLCSSNESQTEKKFSKLQNNNFKEILQSTNIVRVISQKNTYDFIFKINTSSLDQLNSLLVTCIKSPKIIIRKPVRKDFNEDLQSSCNRINKRKTN